MIRRIAVALALLLSATGAHAQTGPGNVPANSIVGNVGGGLSSFSVGSNTFVGNTGAGLGAISVGSDKILSNCGSGFGAVSAACAGSLKLDGSAGNPSSGINSFVLQLGNGSFPGIGFSDTGAIGLWSSGSGTQLNIGFASGGGSALSTNAFFSNTTALSLTPPGSSTAMALSIGQTAHGTVSANNCNTALANYCLNSINVASDDIAGSGGIGQVNAFNVTHKVGGATINGAMVAGFFDLEVTGADSGSICGCYVAVEPWAGTQVSDGGSGPGFGHGGLWGENPNAFLFAGATNWSIVSGAEVNIKIASGASADDKIGWYILLPADDAVQGRTINDAAFAFMNNGTSGGFKGGFVASDLFTAKTPLSSGATFIGTQFSGGPYTIAWGVNLLGFTFTNGAFRSNNFLVDGSGQIAASLYQVAVSNVIVATGVDCPAGISATTGRSVKGIITAC